MELSNFRKAIGVFKDHTSLTLAKVSTFSDLRVAIVKATGHNACLAKEHHIRQILTLTSYSRCHAASCVATISQRLCKTKDWVVAVKALILIQRLIQEGNLVFIYEVSITKNNGAHILDMSDFRDVAWANSWDFSAFVRAYALYLREQIDSWIQEHERELHRLYQVQKMLMKNIQSSRHYYKENICFNNYHEQKNKSDLELPVATKDYDNVTETSKHDQEFEEDDCEIELTLAPTSFNRKRSMTNKPESSDSVVPGYSSSSSGSSNVKKVEIITRDNSSFLSGNMKTNNSSDRSLKQPPWMYQVPSLNMT